LCRDFNTCQCRHLHGDGFILRQFGEMLVLGFNDVAASPINDFKLSRLNAERYTQFGLDPLNRHLCGMDEGLAPLDCGTVGEVVQLFQCWREESQASLRVSGGPAFLIGDGAAAHGVTSVTVTAPTKSSPTETSWLK
jgi:hypothetical protein